MTAQSKVDPAAVAARTKVNASGPLDASWQRRPDASM
jgi:hypothetical protein